MRARATPGLQPNCGGAFPGRSAALLAVRCRAGAVTNAGVWYDPGSAKQHCVLLSRPGNEMQNGERSGVLFLFPEQAELRGVARGLGEAEMTERVRGEQPAARRALQIAALDQERLDDVLDRIARLRQCRRQDRKSTRLNSSHGYTS